MDALVKKNGRIVVNEVRHFSWKDGRMEYWKMVEEVQQGRISIGSTHDVIGKWTGPMHQLRAEVMNDPDGMFEYTYG